MSRLSLLCGQWQRAKSLGNAGDFPFPIWSELGVCEINPTSWQELGKIHFNTYKHTELCFEVLGSRI